MWLIQSDGLYRIPIGGQAVKVNIGTSGVDSASGIVSYQDRLIFWNGEGVACSFTPATNQWHKIKLEGYAQRTDLVARVYSKFVVVDDVFYGVDGDGSMWSFTLDLNAGDL